MAADLVLSSILGVVCDKLVSAGYAILEKLAPYNQIDHSEIEKLQSSLIEIQALLVDASRKEITNHSVKRWLDDLQHVAYDIDDILDEIATEAMHRQLSDESETHISKVRKVLSAPFSKHSLWGRMMKGKINDITTKLHDLVEKKVTLGLIVKEETRPKNTSRRLETSMVDVSRIVGRQAEKEALVLQLLEEGPCDQKFSIVPIVGMGGVGKTTLARLLYNEKQVGDHFQLRVWVCVSDEFDIFRVSNVIFQAVTGVHKEFADLNLLQAELESHLRGERLLLVLDDVWSESYEDWKTLVGPFHACAHGSKIIMTTRKEQLLKKLGYDHINKLFSLSHDDALSLFSLHALGVKNFDSHLSLKPHGEAIVKKCDGLPLALIALGTSLRTKEDEDSWREMVESEIWRSKDDVIVPALRLSYHDMSATLKKLFAYCSLFPKDFLFDKEELVLLWMAEGFLHQPTPSNLTEKRLGHEFFDELLSRSFFQHAPNNESLYVMHDLMNDLAASIAPEFFLRLDNDNGKNIRKGMLEKYRHMSFVRERYVPYKKFEAFATAKSLRTFLATSIEEVQSWNGFYLSNKILTDLLAQLPLLRVLNLSNFYIHEVPESIGTLRHLRYLNLSQTSITYLPENVCNLYNLQSLILFGCSELTKLPNNFLKLKNLRHLDIRETSLLFHTLLGICELKSLQITLSKIVIGSESGSEIGKLRDLQNLYGKISIVGLEKVQTSIHPHEANFSQKRLSELELVWSDKLYDSRDVTLEKDILNELKPCDDKLIKLQIRLYGGLEFPNWVGDPLFLHLKHVSLIGCKRCTSLPPLAHLPSLKELFIEGLHGVEVVGFEIFEAGHTFPSLEILSFKDMRGWKKWSGVVSPCLQNLTIEACPNLMEVTLEALPSLNYLNIYSCDSGVLRSVVQVAPTVTTLKIRDISGLNDVVWRGAIEYLGAVEELNILMCNEIRYLVKSDAIGSKVLVNLRKLEVWNCDNLVSLAEKEEEDNCRNLLPSLRILQVNSCKNMERCSCPDGIEELTVGSCRSIKVVSFPEGGPEKLRKLQINYWELLEWEWGGQKMHNNRSSSMPMLEYVRIHDFPNLKSIIELNCLVHLTELIIDDCESLESFPDNLSYLKNLVITNCPKLDGSFLRGNFPSLKKLVITDCLKLDVSFLRDNLTSLKELEIVNCPSMDASDPGWVWPPNLCSLLTGKLMKPISEWGPQNFPTSLVKLTLYGGEDGARSCSQLSHLLPSSLTSLTIHEFEKLETVSTGLQHLTSLRHLSFYGCLKMIELPELLLPSLLSLSIWGIFPGLNKRCSKNGSYWPLISHIPYFVIFT